MATTDKYDRQLRLWEGHGQRLLGQGKCIMLGTSSAGTETLKNLVLPGFGNITIVDDKCVEQRDLGNDFFVTVDDIGKPKAEVALAMLLEMNPDDVQGSAVVSSASEFVQSSADKILEAQLIIATDVDDAIAVQLSDLTQPRNIPLLVLRQYGMIGYLRVSKPVNGIVQTKMAQVKFKDLRVTEPWEELQAFADGFDLDSMPQIDYIHTPYAVVLIKACQKWRAEHDGAMPTNFAQKREFLAMIKSMKKFVVAENFDEAEAAYTECFKSNSRLPDNISNIFEEFADLIASSNENFWLMVRALKQFVADQGRLPVQGTIPDMISQPRYYMQLQKIYLERSQKDIDIMNGLLQGFATQNGAAAVPVEMDELTRFVRHSNQLDALRMTTIREELEAPKWGLDVEDELMDPSAHGPRWLLAIKAFEKAAASSQNPATFSDDQANNAAELAAMKAEAKAMTDAIGAVEIEEKYLAELLRYGRTKLHCVSSFIGGVASQEACKLVMSQYMPMNHTLVYDGIHGGGQVFNL